MRVLFSTSSPASYMQPPRLGDEQVNCGPDWTDDRAPDGRVRSFATPPGEYDLAALAAKLPPEQAPDLVVCLVDASWRNLPRNLGAIRCPKVLLIADTHHLTSPLIGMMRYVASEAFDRVVFLYDRHHASFFHAAGLRQLHWFPGLTFPHGDAAVQAARRAQRTAHIAFVGQVGKFHPRRAPLLAALTARKLPVAQQALPQRQALDFYGASLLGFNASLNGDLNLRVFEVLAAGAGLLTDRLAPESGLGALFTDGRELATYANAAELADRAADYLARPAAARAMGEAGARWFDEHFSEMRRRDMFRALAFDGVTPPMFAFTATETTRVFFGGDTDRLLQSLIVYEGVQELHRTQETVRVALDATVPADFAAICATLPRVETPRPAGPADLAVFGREHAAAVPATSAARLWCWDAAENDFASLSHGLAPAGYALASRDVAVFCRPTAVPAARPVDDLVRGRELFQQGNLTDALPLARAALARDNRSVEALVLLGEIASRSAGAPLAEKLFRQALELRPGDTVIQSHLAQAQFAQGNLREAGKGFVRVLKKAPQDLTALLALARVRAAEGKPVAAEAALRDAVAHHPVSPAATRLLGDLLKGQGRSLEALTWHRRSVGGTGTVAPVAPTPGRPLRVAFLLQNPQGWTSLASVWRAMVGDVRFAPAVIAAPYQHPYPPEGGPEAIYGFLERAGVPFTRWDRVALTPGFADVLFVQNPYDVTRPAPLHIPNLLQLVPRLAYMPYGLEIGGGEQNNTMVMNMPLQQLAWMVFARSERQRQSYARHCRSGNAHVVVTGHAKLDALRDLSAVDTGELDQFAAGRKLVGWNPHFDMRPDGTPCGAGFSTFLRWWEFVLAEFARRPDLALVIRPHPLFFGTLEARRIWSRAQVDDFVRRVTATGNIRIDRNPSYLPLFKRADAMMSDASSFVLEYCVTGRPLLYLHNPHGPQLNDDGEFVREQLYTAEQDAEMRRFLDHVAAGEDPRGAARRAAYPHYMHQPAEGVGVAAKLALLDRLRREAAMKPGPAGRPEAEPAAEVAVV